MSFAIHLVSDPFPWVGFAVCPFIVSKTMNFIFAEFSVIQRSICKFQNSFAFLMPIRKLPLILSTIWPNLFAMTMLFVILPLSLIDCAIWMSVCSYTMSLIVLPLSRVNVSISMDQLSLSICFVVYPLSLIFGAILPLLSSETNSNFSGLIPVATVYSPIGKDHRLIRISLNDFLITKNVSLCLLLLVKIIKVEIFDSLIVNFALDLLLGVEGLAWLLLTLSSRTQSGTITSHFLINS